ncbi:UNVERIFIED_CONTAM: hypothetical protein Sangu_2881100 [Sesamum angustifolium]|uniref:Uncharacterized protein n=1 Tax=Sesamum angustifolium TaxID=2727405 RepID=A0AAW2IN50_9LAMI
MAYGRFALLLVETAPFPGARTWRRHRRSPAAGPGLPMTGGGCWSSSRGYFLHGKRIWCVFPR